MRLLWLALLATGAVREAFGRAEPGKIVVGEDRTKSRPEDKKWKPYESKLFREERVHGEVLVLSPPLFVRGPPKGFPFRRPSKREAEPNYDREYRGRQNRLPENVFSNRVQGEVIVNSSPLNIKGPPKGFPLKRTSRSVQLDTNIPDSSEPRTISKKGVKPMQRKQSMMKRLSKMWPYFLVPTMMTLAYAPFVLSSVKMFIMNALMVNMMAFNAAIFLTLRNMVFGPRTGGHTKYYNFGYEHQHRRPHYRR